MRTRPPLLALSLLCALSACRRQSEGQTGVLLTLTTKGPVQCVTLHIAPAGGQSSALTQSLQPADFGDAQKWRTASATALIYSGGPLGEGSIDLSADGHRGTCDGPVVANLPKVTVAFVRGRIVPAGGVLQILNDQDGDGWPTPEDCDDTDPTVYPGAPELCDGKDHSCSGVVDKGCACTGGPRPCYPLGLDSPTLQHGICRAGSQSCIDGKWSATCAGAVTPEPERCDNQDHDCDGTIGLPSCPCSAGTQEQCYTKGPTSLAGVGRCKWGKRTCGADGFFGPCVGDVGPLPYELCNNIDDNCNGTVDEEVDAQGKPVMPRPPCAKQKGVCAGSKESCRGGSFAACDTPEYSEAAQANGTFYGDEPSTCDGIDHNCDGVIGAPSCQSCTSQGQTRDCYGPGLNSPTLQHAPCHAGTQTCIHSQGSLTWSTCAGEHQPQPEKCDGVDNDCNGAVDDLTPDEGKPCATGQSGVCAAGANHCAQGANACTPLTAPSAEICDGLDNNCNGTIDEGFAKQTDPQHCGGTYDCQACAAGDACCAGRCGDLTSDVNNCGACGLACAGGQGCCAGRCVDLGSVQNCGACGKACDSGLSCRNGQCAGAHETDCQNGVDDDLDGLTDCQDPDCQGKVCDGTGGTCNGNTCQHESNCSDGLDNDGDGLADCADPDCRGKRCNAANAVCTPDGRCVLENCTNGVDDNGDGRTDCQDSLACPAPGGFSQAICCGTVWVDGSDDVHHCGACSTDCTAGHSRECGSIDCVSGQCRYGSVVDRTACSSGVCCSGNCVPDRETSCTDGLDNNCDGLRDCQDPASCPAPGGETSPRCCNLAWTDIDHGDVHNCGACGKLCAPPTNACSVAVCAPGSVCTAQVDCTIAGCDGFPCGNGAQCAGGSCCAGCVDGSLVCQSGRDLHACVSADGSCDDCDSHNPCITDACTATGCTHAYNTSSCTDDLGQQGVCRNGACCAGCFDGNGVCQEISVDHCGTVGGTCLAQSCNDGNSCTDDFCTGSGTCVHTANDGNSCSDGSAPGVCAAGTCCLGCIESGSCVQPGSESPAQCGSGGDVCESCPPPDVECQSASCSVSGGCGVTNLADGTSCSGGAGKCSNGNCVTTCATKCGGVCCAPDQTCNSNVCGCNSTTCGNAGGICDSGHCVDPSPQACGDNNKFYCPVNASCVSSCNFTCGGGTSWALETCGGTSCLYSGQADTSNVCSDGVHPESCDLVFSGFSASQHCSCDDSTRPGTCPGSGLAVCVTANNASHCYSCGDSGTDGLACKGGGTCKQSSKTCQ